MRRLLFVGIGLTGLAQAQALPGAAELRSRAVESFKKSSAAREKYVCRELIRNEILDSKGATRKIDRRERELFYVNGFEISQDLARDGKPLNASELQKRDQDVRKAIQAASEHKAPKSPGLVINASDILKLAKLVNERRILVDGRPTIAFDVVSDAEARPVTVEERLVAAMEGTVSIDEMTGNLQDVNTRGVKDVKIGGGLIANVHKGFAMHIVVAPQPDGVWLLKLAEGTGEARMGLVVRSGMRFRQETEGCRLYDVSSTQETKPPAK
jgi:hypothetical protein